MSCDCGAEPTEEINKHLTDDGIHMFTAHWCGHCQSMRRNNDSKLSMHAVNRSLEKGERKGVTVFNHDVPRMDKEEEAATTRTFGHIDGYPTIYLVKNGQNQPYTGSRRIDDIVKAYERFNV